MYLSEKILFQLDFRQKISPINHPTGQNSFLSRFLQRHAYREFRSSENAHAPTAKKICLIRVTGSWEKVTTALTYPFSQGEGLSFAHHNEWHKTSPKLSYSLRTERIEKRGQFVSLSSLTHGSGVRGKNARQATSENRYAEHRLA